MAHWLKRRWAVKPLLLIAVLRARSEGDARELAVSHEQGADEAAGQRRTRSAVSNATDFRS